MRTLGLVLAATIALVFVGLSIGHGGGHVALTQMVADVARYGPLTLLVGMAIPAFCPTPNFAKFSTLVYPTVAAQLKVLTTAGGAVTMTVAELLSGLLTWDCDDAQTATTPTAAAIVAAINGCQVGQSFDVDIINYGDTTLTIALGTGVTKVTIHTVAAVLTIATLNSKRFKFVVTSVTPGAEAVVVYAFGSIAAAVA